MISTYQRPEECERALRSVLAQTLAPLEVLICDDGSADETPARFREWERRCEKVRYLRVAHNTGTPASPRNLGIEHARGEWVAFLDDDDQWLPQKLARQRDAIVQGEADVIATNALRSDGSPYFPDAPPVLEPTSRDLLFDNPVITSSAVVRRSLANFPTSHWMRGIEDYAAWLAMADRGARFVVLGEPLVCYEDDSRERLSTEHARRERAMARLAIGRMLRRPGEPARTLAAVRWIAGATYVAIANGLATVANAMRSIGS